MANRTNNPFGSMSHITEIDNSTNHLESKTKTMEISLNSFHLLQSHSKKYHSLEEQPISYDMCISELCNFWNSKHNQKYIHFDRN
jgi:hypothetical protein